MDFLRSIMLVKSVENLKSQAEASGLRRALTGTDVVLIGTGEIIGAGIFVITGTAAANHAGPAIILSFIISGVICAFAGLCYSEMAAAVPVSGSAYTFTYATVGELVAWMIGWDLMLEYLVGAAAVAVGWSGYLVKFLKECGVKSDEHWVEAPWDFSDEDGFKSTGSYINLPAVAIALGVTVVLCLGIRQSAWVNHAAVAIKVTVILIFLCATFSYINPDNWTPFIPEPHNGKDYGFKGVLRASTMVFFAYIGFDAVSTCAQEVKNPARDMPIGILGSLGVCTVLYILVSMNLTGIAPYETLNSASPLADAVANLGMTWLRILIALGAVAGLSSVILVSLLAQPRIFSAMAQDGLLPPSFGKIHPRYKTPVLPTLVSGCFCAVAAGLLPINVLGDLTSAGTLFAFFLVCLSVTVLRFTRPDLERPFRVPLGPFVIPILGAATSMGLIVTTGWPTVLRLLIWMALGLVVYFAYGMRHSVLRTGKKPEGLESPVEEEKPVLESA
ncbi:amino acid transporter [Allomyces macrogynus ATCC 38327]|uniref:Amino acid transporter n=1 Tax=Allomyces macrogynus (strain ATCC 38327) TaxID=578462 RepID=A0A0L0TAP7_ALLM3|nr:amino acid transporter [Allomyces macrogynus ATCC 38327]|eukprot:KNE71614.1 amino acid transporter [Allomyces macrogynus ATCC 38327]